MDAKNIIQDLIESGLTQAQIAQKVGCRQSYISELGSGKKGARLSFWIATGLKDLHESVRQSKEATHG